MSRPKVIYWNNQPTPYLVDRLNAVVANGNTDVEAWFETERESDRSWAVDPSSWGFSGSYLSSTKVGPLQMPFPDRRLIGHGPDVLITPIDRKAAVAAVSVGRAIAKRVAARTLPMYATWTNQSRASKVAFSLLYRAIDGAKVPGDDGVRWAERFGLPRERCWTVTQSIDLGHYQSSLQIGSSARADGRRSRGLSGCVFLYVGRLHHDKGIRHLLGAFRQVQRMDAAVSLLVVGDGRDERELRAAAEGMSGVHFEGFVQAPELPSLYALADVFVFPTLGDPNGLVVEEAMAAGLPVISTTNAGDIHQRIQEATTGFVVPAFDPGALAEKMLVLAADAGLRSRMARAAAESAAKFSMQQYADDFDQFIEGLLAKERRRNAATFVTRAAGTGMLGLARGVAGSQTVS